MLAPVWRRLLREPLVHFVVLGALVFGAHAAITREASSDARRIALGAALMGELEKEFSRKHGRSPSPAEAEQIARSWASEEVLFREGMKLGLDQGDAVVRERVISKMKSVLEGLVIVPEPSDADLQAWLAADRARYQTPVRYDLEHAFAAKSRKDARALAERQLAELEKTGKLEGAGDPFASGARHENRSIEYLTRTFGKGFADAISRAEPKRWQLVESDHGWHAVRVTRRQGGEKPSVATLRGKLVRDWQNARKKELVAAKLAELVASYRVETRP
jgi:hypothetical protein